MMSYLYMAIGGALGTVLRFGLSKWQHSNYIPWHTLVTNVIGSFLIGCFFAYVQNEKLTQNQYSFLAIGLCGGFTTFSTFSLENVQYLQSENWYKFALYTVFTFTLCLAATFLGAKAIKLFN